MNILDRYIAKQYLTNVLLLLVLLFSFVFMIDISLNMQRFVESAVRSAKAAGDEDLQGLRKFLTAALFAINLWWPRLLQLYNFVIGLVLVGGMGFTFAQLVRQRELVAVMASGVSLYRMMRPIMLVACLMLGLQVLNQELVLPRIAHLVVRDNMEAGQSDMSSFVVNLRPDSEGRVFYADLFVPATKTLKGVVILDRDQQWRLTRRITAKSATFDDKRKLWVLEEGLALPTGAGLSTTTPGNVQGTPIDTLRSSLDPTGLVSLQYQSYAQNLSWRQIGDLLLSPTLRGDVKEQLTRIAWGRAANYICVILSLIVAIPFFLTREPKNMVLQSLKCAPVALGSLLGSTLAILSPIPGLPVEFGVFVPVIALLPTAIYMSTSVKT